MKLIKIKERKNFTIIEKFHIVACHILSFLEKKKSYVHNVNNYRRRSTDIKEIRCYECDYPIQSNDDVKVCTVCGGKNVRCNYDRKPSNVPKF